MLQIAQDYLSKKEKGIVYIQKIDSDAENFAICERKYDLVAAAIGELKEIPSEVKGVTMTEVNDEMSKLTADYNAKLAELEAFKKDLLEAK